MQDVFMQNTPSLRRFSESIDYRTRSGLSPLGGAQQRLEERVLLRRQVDISAIKTKTFLLSIYQK